MEKYNLDPNNFNNSVQNRSKNHTSQSLVILCGTPQYFITFFIINLVAFSIEQYRGTAINVAYLEYQLIITNIDSKAPKVSSVSVALCYLIDKVCLNTFVHISPHIGQ